MQYLPYRSFEMRAVNRHATWTRCSEPRSVRATFTPNSSSRDSGKAYRNDSLRSLTQSNELRADKIDRNNDRVKNI